ncbi:hypothetical protein B0T19DRAFT_430429 [Cercophora scortea]|uniref:Uncharacterized protein n=1 Tax=Cercophora scortea TaxID=314031 RepID=A0AAE0I934_9PEZI|nr:hypothetical protein B0T19DRAFT_430429 [Cercophora scortea]
MWMFRVCKNLLLGVTTMSGVCFVFVLFPMCVSFFTGSGGVIGWRGGVDDGFGMCGYRQTDRQVLCSSSLFVIIIIISPLSFYVFIHCWLVGCLPAELDEIRHIRYCYYASSGYL